TRHPSGRAAPCCPCRMSSPCPTTARARAVSADAWILSPGGDPLASSLFHLQAEGHRRDHSANGRRVVVLHHLPDVAESQRLHRSLLLGGEPDDALDQGDLKLVWHRGPPGCRSPPPCGGCCTSPEAASSAGRH